jgi:hypothetical protein
MSDSVEDLRCMLRAYTRTFEHEHKCRCEELGGRETVTGHKHGCPVDEAARLDLARCRHRWRRDRMRLPKRQGASREDIFPGGAKIPWHARLQASWGVCKALLPCIWSGDRSWFYMTTRRSPAGKIRATSVVCAFAPGDMMIMTERMNDHVREVLATVREHTK